jgi:hypothetical protein
MALDVIVGTQVFVIQRDYYTVLTPNVVSGIAELEARTNESQLRAVSPAAHGWPLGWWVEGAAHRKTIYAGNPIWLTYADEKTRNATANNIFGAKTPTDSSHQARNADAAYLFVDKDWAGYTNWIGVRNDLDARMIVYENQGVMIIDTSTGST